MREKANVEVLTTVEALEGWRFFVPLLARSENDVHLGSVVRHVVWPKREKLTAMCISLGNRVRDDFCGEFGAKNSEFRQLTIPNWIIPDTIQSHFDTRRVVQNEVVADSIPSFSGHCGLYGCKSYTELMRQTSFRGVLFGRSYFWGKTIVGSLGHRSQFCYPKSLAGGVCGSCRNILMLKDLVLYLESKSARSRYLGHIKKYQIFCYRCYFSKNREWPDKAKKEQYFEQLSIDYGVTIEENFAKG